MQTQRNNFFLEKQEKQLQLLTRQSDHNDSYYSNHKQNLRYMSVNNDTFNGYSTGRDYGSLSTYKSKRPGRSLETSVLNRISDTCRKVDRSFQINNYLSDNGHAQNYRNHIRSVHQQELKNNIVLNLIKQEKANFKAKNKQFSLYKMAIEKLEYIYRGDKSPSVDFHKQPSDPFDTQIQQNNQKTQQRIEIQEDTQLDPYTELMKKRTQIREQKKLELFNITKTITAQELLKQRNKLIPPQDRIRNSKSPVNKLIIKFKKLINHLYPLFNFQMQRVVDEYMRAERRNEQPPDDLNSLTSDHQSEQFRIQGEFFNKIRRGPLRNTKKIKLYLQNNDEIKDQSIRGINKIQNQIRKLEKVLKVSIKETNKVLKNNPYQTLEEKFENCITNVNKYQ